MGPAVGEGYYVIYLRPEDERLRDEINRVLRELIDTDRLRPIYERYRIWNATQQRLALPEVQEVPAKLRAANEADSLARHWEIVWRNLNLLLKAAGMTVFLSVVSMPLAILLGLLVALGRVYGPLALRVPLTAYVEVLRGTPLLLQLYVIYYVLPTVVTLPEALLPHYALFAAIFGLAVNYSAYEAEIYRAGLLAIPRADGGGRRPGDDTRQGDPHGHRAAGGPAGHPAGDQRLHRPVQGHGRLLRHHRQRVDQGVQRDAHQLQ